MFLQLMHQPTIALNNIRFLQTVTVPFT